MNYQTMKKIVFENYTNYEKNVFKKFGVSTNGQCWFLYKTNLYEYFISTARYSFSKYFHYL